MPDNQSVRILYPNRVANASIYGHLYQACIGVQRWLTLDDGQTLICEGNEDFDLAGPGKQYCSEQVKARAKLDQSEIRPLLRHFVETFHRHTLDDVESRLVLTTTAPRPERLRLANARGDVLARWHEDDHRDAVIEAVRVLVAPVDAKKSSAGIDAALAWLDAEPARWDDFIAAVDWRFDEPDLETLRRRLEKQLAARTSGAAVPTLLGHLVVTVLEHSARQKPEQRQLNLDSLAHHLARTRNGVEVVEAGRVATELIDEIILADRLLETRRYTLPRGDVPPGKLLSAGYEVIPFDADARAAELNELERWCADQAPRSARLIVGAGGQGKTRLLIEFCRRQAERSWLAGFLTDDVEIGDVVPFLTGATPRVIVIDYAETRLKLVQRLLKKVAARKGAEPILRIVFLARHAGDWWRQLTDLGDVIEDFLEPAVHTLPVLNVEPDDRAKAFRDAASAFADHLDAPVPSPLPEPDLGGGELERALYLHMAALATVDSGGTRVTGPADAIGRTLVHERRFWLREAEAMFAADEAMVETFVRDVARSVAALTLTGGAESSEQAKALLRAVAQTPKRREELLDSLLLRLRRLYAGTEGRHLDPLLPDLLGEAHVHATLRADASLVDTVLDAADTEQAHSALTVLTRIARAAQNEAAAEEAKKWLARALTDRLEDLARVAVDVAVQTGDPIGVVLASRLAEEGSLDVVEAVMNRCEETALRTSVPLREVALISTRRTYDAYKRRWPEPTEDQLGTLSRLAHSLGYRLSDIGRREDALNATQEAVDIRRTLANNSPDAFLPDLASSLNNLGYRLSQVGRSEDALNATQEAVEKYHDLAKNSPDAFLPDLASSLNSLGTMLSDFGRREDALDATQKAVDIRRDLADSRPDAFLPDLAKSLNNLGITLSEIGRREDALDAAKEAVNALSPSFLRYPPAFAQWMTTMVANYQQAAKAAGVEPDTELLAPIAAAFIELRASDDTTDSS